MTVDFILTPVGVDVALWKLSSIIYLFCSQNDWLGGVYWETCSIGLITWSQHAGLHDREALHTKSQRNNILRHAHRVDLSRSMLMFALAFPVHLVSRKASLTKTKDYKKTTTVTDQTKTYFYKWILYVTFKITTVSFHTGVHVQHQHCSYWLYWL